MLLVNGTRTIGSALLCTALMSYSCSSGRDIYRYQSNIKVPTEKYSSKTIVTESTGQPAWIYAVSKDYVVGVGYGKDVIEARNAALNDIKSFIIKSMGETGSVVEVNFVENTVSGRSRVESQETYMLHNRFENTFHPVINISMASFEDYYYVYTGNSAKYYIKYVVNEEELKKLKSEFQTALLKEKLKKNQIHQSVDSLLRFPADPDIDFLVKRYDTLLNFIYSNLLDPVDSLQIVRSMQNISSFLHNVEVRVVENVQGKYVRFGLFSGESLVNSGYTPRLNSQLVTINNLVSKNNIWIVNYYISHETDSPVNLEVYFVLPYTRISSVIKLSDPPLKTGIIVNGNAQISELHKDNWNGIIKGFTVSLNINYNGDEKCYLTDLELFIPTDAGKDASIIHVTQPYILKAGSNSIVQTANCHLPTRLFLRSQIEGDLSLKYQIGNRTEKTLQQSIPVTIKNN